MTCTTSTTVNSNSKLKRISKRCRIFFPAFQPRQAVQADKLSTDSSKFDDSIFIPQGIRGIRHQILQQFCCEIHVHSFLLMKLGCLSSSHEFTVHFYHVQSSLKQCPTHFGSPWVNPLKVSPVLNELFNLYSFKHVALTKHWSESGPKKGLKKWFGHLSQIIKHPYGSLAQIQNLRHPLHTITRSRYEIW